MDVEIKLVRSGASVPERATKGSAGFDLRAAIDGPLTLEPGDMATVPTGIAIRMREEGFAALCFARSGLGVKHGVTLSNGVGVIDSDYTGEIMVGLVNISRQKYTVEPWERIAQLVFVPVGEIRFLPVSELGRTARGEGGFGSSGRG